MPPNLDSHALKLKGQLIDDAALRDNTKVAIQRAVTSFHHITGQHLPCNTEQVLEYMAHVTGDHRVATIETRISLIGRWHRDMGFEDPTKDPRVARRMKGIKALTNAPPKQAGTLSRDDIEMMVLHLEDRMAVKPEDASLDPRKVRSRQLAAIRDKAYILMSFWFGLRSDTATKIQIEHLGFKTVDGIEVLDFYIPTSKTKTEGERKELPSLPSLNPVSAMKDWLANAHLMNEVGPVFRPITAWGKVLDKGLHIDSIKKMVRTVLSEAGLTAELYSTHSFRRGLAQYFKNHRVDTKDAIHWIGWKDERSYLRYQTPTDALPYKLLTAKQQPFEQAIDLLKNGVREAAQQGRLNHEERQQLLQALATIESVVPNPSRPKLDELS